MFFLNSCYGEKKEEDIFADTSDASEIQLNAVEFRNYRTRLDPKHQDVVGAIVNQWCAKLVRGKTMRVQHGVEKCFLDKDLLTFYVGNDAYILKNLKSMNFCKDQYSDAQYILELSFEGTFHDADLSFGFEDNRERLHFALTLRILRSRDPTLDPEFECEVTWENPEQKAVKFADISKVYRLHPDRGFPVVFSISDVKVFSKVQATSRQLYLEFFVAYPSQDPWLYAKSPNTPMHPAMVAADEVVGKRKAKEGDDLDRKKDKLMKSELERRAPIAQLRFELKNVKIKVPQVPHTLFGRLMAKDEFFPTALGTFEIPIREQDFVDKTKKKPGQPPEVEGLQVEIKSASKMTVYDRDPRSGEDIEEKMHVQIADRKSVV